MSLTCKKKKKTQPIKNKKQKMTPSFCCEHKTKNNEMMKEHT